MTIFQKTLAKLLFIKIKIITWTLAEFVETTKIYIIQITLEFQSKRFVKIREHTIIIFICT